jgi:hypothetical protein
LNLKLPQTSKTSASEETYKVWIEEAGYPVPELAATTRRVDDFFHNHGPIKARLKGRYQELAQQHYDFTL